MTDRGIRVLLIDGQLEDSHWVRELLADFDENRYGGGWMHGIEVFPIDRLSDALTLLGVNAGEQFDAVLLNPNLIDSYGLHSFLRVQAVAPDIPVIVLAELDDPDLAISIVRAGAQDYLPKNQLDSLPLARALRLAVERARITRNLRSLILRDEWTGMVNRAGFDFLAERDLAAARQLDRSLAVMMVELHGMNELALAYGKDEQNLAMIEAAEVLRSSTAKTACLAQVDHHRFAISLLSPNASDVTSLQTILQRRFHLYNLPANRNLIRIHFGVAWFHPKSLGAAASAGGDQLLVSDLLASAAQSLCENKWHIHTDIIGRTRPASGQATGTGRNV